MEVSAQINMMKRRCKEYLKKYRQFSWIKTVVRVTRSFNLICAAIETKALNATNRNNVNSKTVAERKVDKLNSM